MKTDQQLQQTHQLYCTLSGYDIQWNMQRSWYWECFCNRFNDDDLKVVIAFIKRKMNNGQPARSLNFRSLISGPMSLNSFEEDLLEAKARNRAVRVDTNRESVLRTTGRVEPAQDKLKSAAQIIKDNAALAQLLNMRDTL